MNHITHFGDFLDNYLLLLISYPIKVGNSATVNVIAIGTVMLPIVTLSGSYMVTLSDVYHALDFGDVSLISLGQLQECGSRYFLSPGGITVQKGDRTVLYGYLVSQLYQLQQQSTALITTCSRSEAANDSKPSAHEVDPPYNLTSSSKSLQLPQPACEITISTTL
ncbi:hypothetical protein L873DRAFT_1788009 [Choiromyces venosus 120613-1]|uniref:Retrovirus-related Pol polyprotein from transposon TNT 1-94-like beta-barrel domain-containing protein n=1 Tax=Choiromyces venosus 120613-1 TaxID=1336337 RepID=A0A3N4K7Q2_9PEZI|nr:hypothetical protein L873DRAFT_1788009 [Choiromyces venosus 120613-1]